MYYGKKDRIYLDGVWKLLWGRNLMTEEFLSTRMEQGPLAKGGGLLLKKNVTVNDADFNDDAEAVAQYVREDFDDRAWMDVPVPRSWTDPTPWESPDDRGKLAARYLKRGKLLGYYFSGVGYYRKSFALPDEKKSKRYFLHFMNVDTLAKVWVNGRCLTPKEHANISLDADYRVYGAWLNDFECEIPESALHFGGEKNTIALRVFAKGVPCYWNAPNPGGITAPVWLETREPVFADKIAIVADYKTSRIRLTFTLNGAADSGGSEGVVTVSPWTSEDYSFPGQGATFEYPYKIDGGRCDAVIPLPGTEFWSPDKPCLYQLQIRNAQGRVIGLERFGFSTLEARGNQLFLNGRNVYLRGLNTQHALFDFTGGGNPAELTRDRRLYNDRNFGRNILMERRRAGFNYMRVHTGPGVPWGFALCDEVGLIASDEWTSLTASALAPNDKDREVEYLYKHDYSCFFDRDDNFKELHRGALEHWMASNVKYPSVLLFNGGNEPKECDRYFQLFAQNFYKTLKQADPRQRLVAPASGVHLAGSPDEQDAVPPGQGPALLPADYFDMHDYGPFTRWGILDTRMTHAGMIGKIDSLYGTGKIPVINGETFLAFATERSDRVMPADYDYAVNGDFRKFLTYFKANASELQILSSAAFGFDSLFDMRVLQEERILWLRKYLAAVRVDVPEMQGYALHMPDNYWMRPLGPDGKRETGFGGLETRGLTEVQTPVQILPKGIGEFGLFAGETANLELAMVNSSGMEPVDAEGEVLIDGVHAAKFKASADAGRIAPVTVRVPLPPLETGWRRISFTLRTKDVPIPPYSCDLFLVNRKDAPAPIADAYVIDDAGETATSICRSLKITAHAFDAGSAGRLLIVAPGSLPSADDERFAAIDTWMRNGGRVLVLEQKPGTQDPWSGQTVVAVRPYHMSYPAVSRTHPLMRDLRPRNFGYWRGGAVYDSYFPTIDYADVLVVGCDGLVRKDGKTRLELGMIAFSRHVGNGAYAWTQHKIAANHQTDSSAYCIMRNLVQLLVSDRGATDAK